MFRTNATILLMVILLLPAACGGARKQSPVWSNAGYYQDNDSYYVPPKTYGCAYDVSRIGCE